MMPWLSKRGRSSLPIVSWEGFPTLRPDAGRVQKLRRKIVKCNFNCWPIIWPMTQGTIALFLNLQFSPSPMWHLKLLEVTLNRVKVSWKRSMIGHWSWKIPLTISICCDLQVRKLKWLSVSKTSTFPKTLLKGNSLLCSQEIWSQGRAIQIFGKTGNKRR